MEALRHEAARLVIDGYCRPTRYLFRPPICIAGASRYSNQSSQVTRLGRETLIYAYITFVICG
jgi:hypothetical protein